MNRTLIKNLYVQCVVEKGKEKSFQVRDLDTAELFAERIVQECIGIVESYPSWYGDYRDQIENAFRGHLVAKMKYHFGVES